MSQCFPPFLFSREVRYSRTVIRSYIMLPIVCVQRFPFHGTAPPIGSHLAERHADAGCSPHVSRMVKNRCEYQPTVCKERPKAHILPLKRRNRYV